MRLVGTKFFLFGMTMAGLETWDSYTHVGKPMHCYSILFRMIGLGREGSLQSFIHSYIRIFVLILRER